MTVLLEISGLFKIVESFAVFVCIVIHRIGYRGSQVMSKTLNSKICHAKGGHHNRYSDTD